MSQRARVAVKKAGGKIPGDNDDLKIGPDFDAMKQLEEIREYNRNMIATMKERNQKFPLAKCEQKFWDNVKKEQNRPKTEHDLEVIRRACELSPCPFLLDFIRERTSAANKRKVEEAEKKHEAILEELRKQADAREAEKKAKSAKKMAKKQQSELSVADMFPSIHFDAKAREKALRMKNCWRMYKIILILIISN